MDCDMATILDIQRLSTEDGPGLRTTVFFKGCNLACAWCHNPESIASRKQLQWFGDRCIECGHCVAACPNRGLTRNANNSIAIDRNICTACSTCVKICPTGAMEIKGVSWTLDALLHELLKDRAFFGTEGGITLSGGEVMMQSVFAAHLLARLQEAGISTAVDTAGMVSWKTFLQIIPYTNLFLLDIKLIDNDRHKLFTKVGNNLILDNARCLAEWIDQHKGPTLWIRTPIIPGATDTDDNIAGIGQFINRYMQGSVARWELCAFNNLCRDKYERLEQSWDYVGAQLITQERMEQLSDIGRSQLSQPEIVCWTGTTRMMDEHL